MVQLKYHFLLLLLLNILPLTAQIKVQGEFLSSEDYNKVYLYEYFGRNFFPIDTFELNKGQFEFTYDQIERGFYRIGVDAQNSINLILGNESFSMKADLKDLFNTTAFSDSYENQLYMKYLKFSINYMRSAYQLEERKKTATDKPDSLKDTMEISLLNNSRDSLNQARFAFLYKIREENAGYFMQKVAASSVFENDPEEFFDEEDFQSSELTRGDMLASKINYYFRTFVPSNINAWDSSFLGFLERTEPGSRIREFWYITYIGLLNMAAQTHVWDMTNLYLEEYPNSKYFSYLLNALPQKPPSIGDQAPEIALSDPSGNIINLSSLRGNVVLIDFWASWCGPCRRENPNVVSAFHAFKDQGFTVYGVSLDRNKDRWVQAIEKDQLTWNHVSDLKGWKSEGAAIYKVRAIPAAFLIDQDGKIIAKNLRGKALHNKLKELFDQN